MKMDESERTRDPSSRWARFEGGRRWGEEGLRGSEGEKSSSTTEPR